MNKALIIIAAVGAVLVAAGAFLVPGYLSDQTDRAETLAVADRFNPGSTWQQTENRLMGTFLCTPGDLPCHSLLRRWRPDHSPSSDELRAILTEAGWELSVKGDCQPPSDGFTGTRTLCSASGPVESYNARVSFVRPGTAAEFVELELIKITTDTQ
jgi:hypothetical protein